MEDFTVPQSPKETVDISFPKFTGRLKQFLTPHQRQFINLLKVPFVATNDPEHPIKINRLTDIVKQLGLEFATPFCWKERNKNFRRLWESIDSFREEIYNRYAKESIIANIIDKKEISLIFYLKNKVSEEYKDDSVLNQIFLKQNSINLNLIQTTVNNYNTIQLIDKAKELSIKLDKLNTSKGNTKL